MAFFFQKVSYGQKPATFISLINHGDFVHLYNSLLFEEGGQFTITLTEKGQLEEINPVQPIMLFSATSTQDPVYVEPGDSIQVSIVNNSLMLHCINNTIRNNELSFLSDVNRNLFPLKMLSFGSLKQNIDKQRIRNGDVFYQDSLYGEICKLEIKHLTSYSRNHQLSERFIKFMCSYFKFNCANTILEIVLKKHIYNPPTFLNSILTDSVYNDYFYSEESQYKAYLRASKKYLAICNSLRYTDEIILSKNIEIKNYLLYKAVQDKMADENSDSSITLDSLYYIFLNECTDTSFANTIRILRHADTSLQITDNLLNTQHAIVSNPASLLKAFSGKLLLVDFWASWCIPCLKEMRFAESLLGKFKKNRFSILFISLDENSTNWIKMQKRFWFMSEQNSYLLGHGFESALAKKYKIKAIPRYMLIDTNGKLITSDAPDPSDPKLEELLKKRFKQN